MRQQPKAQGPRELPRALSGNRRGFQPRGGYRLGLQEKGLEFLALPSPSHETCGCGFTFPRSPAQPCRRSSHPPRAGRLCKALRAACAPCSAQHRGCILPGDTPRVQRAPVFQAEGRPQLESSLLAVQNLDAERRRGFGNLRSSLWEEEG